MKQSCKCFYGYDDGAGDGDDSAFDSDSDGDGYGDNVGGDDAGGDNVDGDDECVMTASVTVTLAIMVIVTMINRKKKPIRSRCLQL